MFGSYTEFWLLSKWSDVLISSTASAYFIGWKKKSRSALTFNSTAIVSYGHTIDNRTDTCCAIPLNNLFSQWHQFLDVFLLRNAHVQTLIIGNHYIFLLGQQNIPFSQEVKVFEDLLTRPNANFKRNWRV